MILKEIKEYDYEAFVSKHDYSSFYQSLEWYNLKKSEGKKCKLLGLYSEDKLFGVSLIVYVRILKKYHYAYASRGFVYNYENIKDFTLALKDFFSREKNVIFFRMDPPVILNSYGKGMEKYTNEGSANLISELKKYGFLHYGYNKAFETMQFRFIHRLETLDSFDLQLESMNKSTRKNIEHASTLGVKIKEVTKDNLDDVFNLFESTVNRKKIYGFSKSYYLNLIDKFNDNVIMYIAYIDKDTLINNTKNNLELNNKELTKIQSQMQHDNVGKKLIQQEMIIKNNIKKNQELLSFAHNLSSFTNIASMLCIKKYNEIVSYVSGMDNQYRKFCPKYALYPAMIRHAINNNIKYVNFLGVKNIFDKTDKDYGILEVKRGFGGETIEYIGEFDLPIKKGLYKLFKVKENYERKKTK